MRLKTLMEFFDGDRRWGMFEKLFMPNDIKNSFKQDFLTEDKGDLEYKSFMVRRSTSTDEPIALVEMLVTEPPLQGSASRDQPPEDTISRDLPLEEAVSRDQRPEDEKGHDPFVHPQAQEPARSDGDRTSPVEQRLKGETPRERQLEERCAALEAEMRQGREALDAEVARESSWRSGSWPSRCRAGGSFRPCPS